MHSTETLLKDMFISSRTGGRITWGVSRCFWLKNKDLSVADLHNVCAGVYHGTNMRLQRRSENTLLMLTGLEKVTKSSVNSLGNYTICKQ